MRIDYRLFCAAFALTTLAAACGGNDDDGGGDNPVDARPSSGADGAPQSDAASEPSFPGVSAFVEESIADRRFSGAVVAIYQAENDELFLESYGLMDIENNVPMRNDAIFRIASMTKPITSAVAMKLVESGQLDLDVPLSTYLPEWANPVVIVPENPGDPNSPYTTTRADWPLNVRSLLNHTSGLTYGFFGTHPLSQVYKDSGISDGLTQTDTTLEAYSQALAALPLLHEPGARFSYGLSVDILGRLIEVVAQKPLDQVFQEQIFEPLGMNDCHFFVPADKAERMPKVYWYDVKNASLSLIEGEVTDGEVVFSSDYHLTGPQTFFSGGAGLACSTQDYLRFLRMMLNGGELEGVQVLEAETVELMTQNRIGSFTAFEGMKFGFGFGIQSSPELVDTHGSVGTYTWDGFFHSTFWVDPDRDLIGIFMSQHYRSDMNFTYEDEIKAKVYEEVNN